MSTLQTTILKHPDSATNNIQFDSAGLVGVGAAPTRPLTVSSSAGATNILGVFNNSGTSASNCVIAFSDPTSTQGQFSTRIGSFGDGLKFYTNGPNEALEITSDGNVLLTRDSDVRIELGTNGTTATNDRNHIRADGDNLKYNACENGTHIFEVNGAEQMRVNGSAQFMLGVGSTSFASTAIFQGSSASSNTHSIVKLACDSTAPADAGNIGVLQFCDGSHRASASISTQRHAGTWSGTSKPGRLLFGTTADGDNGPTTRMTINSQGDVLIGQSTTTQPGDNNNVQGLCFRVSDNSGANTGRFYASAGADHNFNRTSDGVILAFRSEGVNEGAVSISGSTVTYGGGHLARWSQLLNNADPSGILKGTVMSNLDEMCEWGEEDNEQLNRTKISDVEGDLNVAGVFVSTSFNDEGPYDFYVGMTGDMIIRIAEGVTVQRGDLLMSAGDGTAKPQEDDIVRGKTIAKVISTNVTCTYADGSYCVPCVLMAC